MLAVVVRELSKAPVCFLFDCCIFIVRFMSLSWYSSAKTRIRPVKLYHWLLCPNTVWLYSCSLHLVNTETNCCHSAAANCLRRSSLKNEEEEERPTTTAQHPPTISRRPSPKEVQSLTVSPQQAHTALLKLVKRPKKLEVPQVKSTSKPMAMNCTATLLLL